MSCPEPPNAAGTPPPPACTTNALHALLPTQRSALALATWLVSGRALWLLPNVMSEELPISQIFKPLVAVSRPEEGKGRWANGFLSLCATHI